MYTILFCGTGTMGGLGIGVGVGMDIGIGDGAEDAEDDGMDGGAGVKGLGDGADVSSVIFRGPCAAGGELGAEGNVAGCTGASGEGDLYSV